MPSVAYESDRRAEIEALREFLRASSERWAELAPRLVEQVGADRLERIVAATRERLGGFHEVSDSPEGLVVEGPGGRVLAWVHVGRDGLITGLLISPVQQRRRRLPLAVGRSGGRVACFLLAGFLVFWCWTAPDVLGWTGAVFALACGGVLIEGFGNAAMEPWWVRRPVQAGALVALGSACRLPGLPLGGHWLQLASAAVPLAVSGVALVRSRRHSWGTGPAVPLARFPLRGSWYVGQGGGRGLNHHVDVDEQRGAVDLVRLGRSGTYRGDSRLLTSYHAYGAEVFAPCDGLVVAAVDGLPDQVPGVIRYGPLYGNHVFIDTGTETVKLAHLRPGTVRVAVGEQVRAGQPLGQVGNSGNSSEPHLHLHAERHGEGLDLVFADVGPRLHRGRTVRA
ncbi:hypothetical protein GCM10010430_34900 [Kitasatospora cystarginea]|uniref:M23ase beta-sheet core domain-containing protein n=1 Tax=Kitasatospora cystarginea TaxID=58350 RepID=A0ABP5R2L9_9ACTN